MSRGSAVIALLISAAAHAASVCSIQSGEVSLPESLDAGPSSVEVSLKPVLGGQTVLWYGYRGSNSLPPRLSVGLEPVSDAGVLYALRLTRPDSSTARVVVWHAAEFCGGVRVERGRMAVSPTSTVVHAPIKTSKSYAMQHSTFGGTNYNFNDFYRLRPIDDATTEIADSDVNDLGNYALWQRFEHDGMQVWRGLGALAPGTLSAVESPPVVGENAFARVTWRIDGGSGNGSSSLTARLLADGGLEVSRGLATNTVDYAWEVVAFTDGTRVLTGRAALASGSGAFTVDLQGRVDPARAVAFTAGDDWKGAFSGTASDPGATMVTCSLKAPAALELRRAVTSSGAVIDWVVLEFPDGGADAGVDAGEGGDDGGGVALAAAYRVGCGCQHGFVALALTALVVTSTRRPKGARR